MPSHHVNHFSLQNSRQVYEQHLPRNMHILELAPLLNHRIWLKKGRSVDIVKQFSFSRLNKLIMDSKTPLFTVSLRRSFLTGKSTNQKRNSGSRREARGVALVTLRLQTTGTLSSERYALRSPLFHRHIGVSMRFHIFLVTTCL
jgi:hypothetical protein